MKTKIPFLLSALIGGALLIYSCKKYPEGPVISFISKKERLENSWRINQYFENGVDKTSDAQTILKDYNLIINKNGNYTLYYKLLGLLDYNESGTWSFINDNEVVRFYQTSPGSNSSDWTILKLMEKELWGEFQDSSKTIEIHLLPK